MTSEATANRLLTTTKARGSPGYRAPEVDLDSKFSNKVDIWSAGCVLHELAAGRPAFCSDREVVLHYLQNNTFEISVDGLGEKAKSYISDAVSRMLAKEPASRPTARSLHEEFCAYIGWVDVEASTERKQLAVKDTNIVPSAELEGILFDFSLD